ncbi:unnamed protein product [Fraxinus pennsylvanica]|uniref:Zinc finger LSD1-type domain-containing protein n=1 Tax=Fraxinus pennsylvanica TaxID=56036 RepID=A0AAD2AAQ1_9LAMI|nr:unnamed protein product [Fraxinus pennsylvanica]
MVNEMGPPWLKSMLKSDYFFPCPSHSDSNKSECNMYCLDCMGNAFCSYCLIHQQGHRLVQRLRATKLKILAQVVKYGRLEKVLQFETISINLAPAPNIAHVNCGNCRTTLTYPYGAPSVKCAVCQYITNVNMCNVRVPIPMHRPNGAPSSASMPSSSADLPNSQSQTVVVENPTSVDKSGKLVSNLVVGVTMDKK